MYSGRRKNCRGEPTEYSKSVDYTCFVSSNKDVDGVGSDHDDRRCRVIYCGGSLINSWVF